MAFPFTIDEAVTYPSLAAAQAALDAVAAAIAARTDIVQTREPGRLTFRRVWRVPPEADGWATWLAAGELRLAPAPHLAPEGAPVVLRYTLDRRRAAWRGPTGAALLAALPLLATSGPPAKIGLVLALSVGVFTVVIPYVRASLGFYTTLPTPRRVSVPRWSRSRAV